MNNIELPYRIRISLTMIFEKLIGEYKCKISQARIGLILEASNLTFGLIYSYFNYEGSYDKFWLTRY
jgi:hypothetical protein